MPWDIPALFLRSGARQECFGIWMGAGRGAFRGRGMGRGGELFLGSMTWTPSGAIYKMSRNYTGVEIIDAETELNV
jgi:hypothetical protein